MTPANVAQERLQRVRMPDPLPSPCPGCAAPLKSGQAVCSPRCRAKVWRQRKATRDRDVRELLRAALKRLEDPLHSGNG
jgi:predicted nucleic acid-binding Zn ribbon protein